MKIRMNSKLTRLMSYFCVLCIFVALAMPLQASNLSAAQYMRPLEITNTGAESTNNVVVFDPDTLGMITNGFINSSLTGSAITDLANKDFYYMPKEPVRYKLVQYLESDGNQYIDTGYVPNANTKWIANYAYTSAPTATAQFGLYENSTASGGIVRCCFSVNTSFSAYVVWGSGTTSGTSYTTTLNQRLTGIFDNKNENASVQSSVNTAWNTSAGTPTESLYLFVRHNPNASVGYDANFVSVRIYSSQIYDNGVLVRDFVPVQRSTDNALGMLDHVNNVFYPNLGTGTFATAQYQSTMYACEYIESDGHQYIDTGFVPSNSSDVIITGRYMSTPTAQCYLLANCDTTSGTTNRYYLGSWFTTPRLLNMYGSSTAAVPADTNFDTTKIYTCELNPLHGFGSINNITTTFTPSGGSYTLSVAVNAQKNGADSYSTWADTRTYALTMLTNGTMQRNMIPVYNATHQKAGLLDNVNNQLYYSGGSQQYLYKLSGVDGTWCLYLPTVAANTTLSERLYISTENLASKIVYFPGDNGMSANRSAKNKILGSDDWKFSVKGEFISGDGSYIFKYSDDLYATMTGNTITFNYGTLTVPIGTYTHNTNWLYYWGDAGTTFSGGTSIDYGTSYMQNQRSIDGAYNYTYITPSANVSGYNTLIVRAYDNSSNANTKQYVGTGTGALSTSAQAITDNALTRISISTGSVRPNVTVRSSLTSGIIYNRIYLMAVAKADNPTNYSTLTKYGSNVSGMISNSANMLNDIAACITLATKCTGDFMWACVADSTFTTALNSSPYKSIITSSEDWAKALAWNTGSYSTTTPTGATVSLSATQQVPLGYHTYDFRKEGNAVSIYVDNNVVRGGIFNETSLYNSITSLGYTYSQLVSFANASQLTFAQGGTVLFVEEMKQTRNDTDVGWWKWAQTDDFTFPDLSPSDITGYPSYRSTPYGSVNDGLNLSVSLGTYTPANVAQYIPPGGEQDTDFDGLTPGNTQPNQNVNIDNIKNIPFAEVFEDILAAGGIPSQLFWLPLIMIFAIAAMMVTYHFTRDALIACIAGDVVIGLGIALSVLYTVPLVMALITTVVLLVKRKTISL